MFIDIDDVYKAEHKAILDLMTGCTGCGKYKDIVPFVNGVITLTQKIIEEQEAKD